MWYYVKKNQIEIFPVHCKKHCTAMQILPCSGVELWHYAFWFSKVGWSVIVEVVNHVGIYGSNVAEGFSAFQRLSCFCFLILFVDLFWPRQRQDLPSSDGYSFHNLLFNQLWSTTFQNSILNIEIPSQVSQLDPELSGFTLKAIYVFKVEKLMKTDSLNIMHHCSLRVNWNQCC